MTLTTHENKFCHYRCCINKGNVLFFFTQSLCIFACDIMKCTDYNCWAEYIIKMHFFLKVYRMNVYYRQTHTSNKSCSLQPKCFPDLPTLHSHYGVMSIHRNLSTDDKSSLCWSAHSNVALLDIFRNVPTCSEILFNKWCLSLSQRLLCNEPFLLALKRQD